MIEFGTDGWRAVIADTFTFANLRLVAQAVAQMVLDVFDGNNHTPPEMVVGYDTRFLSDRFAIETARVLAANGIVTWLCRSDAPTPAISFNVRDKGAVMGIVITASHNPPRYSGFKLKASYGGSATPAQCREVERHLRRLDNESREPRMMDYQQAMDQGLIRRFDPAWLYYQHLEELVNLDIISDGELSVVADAMWGSGRGALRSILARTRTRFTEIRGALNPGFGGIHPEPILKNLNELVSCVQNLRADVGIATDGDADRVGAIDALGNFVSPHLIFALVLQHLVVLRRMKGAVVKTVSTTSMIDRIAERFRLELRETPVGFNHIAEHMLRDSVLMGGEESGGMSVQGHIPEGDGILMGLLLLELLAHSRTPLHEMVAQLQNDFGPSFYERYDIPMKRLIPKQRLVERLIEQSPNHLNGETVKEVNTIDGIKWRLADHSWLLLRPSGTEPKLRIYAEARSQQDCTQLLQQGLTWVDQLFL